MAVTTTHATKLYNGNSVTVAFPVDFQFFAAADLIVTSISSAGVETVKTLSTHYTVSGGQDANGLPAIGTLTMLSAPATGEKLRIDRNTPLTQSTVHTNNDAFPAKTVEAAYDRARLVEQENRLLVARALKLSLQDYAAGISADLPSPDAGSFLRWNDDGDGIENATIAEVLEGVVSPDDAVVSPFILPLLSVTNAISAGRRLGMTKLHLMQFAPYSAQANILAGTSTTDMEPYIEEAILELASRSIAGEIILPAGRVAFGSPLLQPNGVKLVGEGSAATELFLLNSSNCHGIKSSDFDSLTGQNKWLVSDGMQYGLGLKGLRLNGNKANQSSGIGVQYYAKGLIIDDVIVYDWNDGGWYSEGGDVPGQVDWYDLPESGVTMLRARNNGGVGVNIRGPHDCNWKSVYANQNTGKGVFFDRTPGTYSGECDVGLVHSYANDGINIHIDEHCRVRADNLIGEFGFQEGVKVDGWSSQISKMQAYGNCRTSGDYEVVVTGQHNRIESLQLYDVTDGGLQVTAPNNKIGVSINGEGSAGVGVDLNSVGNKIHGEIYGFTGTGGIGLRTGNSSTVTQSEVDLSIANCETGWVRSAASAQTTFNIMLDMESGQAAWSGTAPNATDQSETWNVRSDENGALKYSQIRKISGADIDLDSTSEQTIAISLTDLIATAEPEDITVALYYTGSNTTFVVQYLKLHAVSATEATFKIKLSTAAGTAATAKLIMTAKI